MPHDCANTWRPCCCCSLRSPAGCAKAAVRAGGNRSVKTGVDTAGLIRSSQGVLNLAEFEFPGIEPVAAADLGLVERPFCPRKKGSGVAGVARIERDADAHGDDRGYAIQDVRLCAQIQDRGGLLHGRRSVRNFEEGGEVVGLEPPEHRAGAKAARDAGRSLAKAARRAAFTPTMRGTRTRRSAGEKPRRSPPPGAPRSRASNSARFGSHVS